MLGVANIYFGNLHRTAPDSYLKELGWAKAMYDLALKADPGCAYAANGLGMVRREVVRVRMHACVCMGISAASFGNFCSTTSLIFHCLCLSLL